MMGRAVHVPPHSGVELALTKTGGDRSAARDLIKDEIMAQALLMVWEAGRSLKCARGDHSSEAYGCRNDGSNCICACHDPEAARGE